MKTPSILYNPNTLPVSSYVFCFSFVSFFIIMHMFFTQVSDQNPNTHPTVTINVLVCIFLLLKTLKPHIQMLVRNIDRTLLADLLAIVS